MTLIVVFTADGLPVVVADVLMSRPGRDEVLLDLPVGRLSAKGDPVSYMPSSFQRKIIEVNEQTVIAWAGHYLVALGMARDLRARFKSGRMTSEQFFSYFDSSDYSENDRSEVSFVGFSFELSERYLHAEVFSQGALIFADGRGGRVHAAGSGVDYFKKYMSDLLPYETLVGDSVPLQRSLLEAIKFTLSALTVEVATQATIGAHFGGFYEIASIGFANGVANIVYFSDVTYIIWKAERIGNDVDLIGAPIIIKGTYVGADLLVGRLHLSASVNPPRLNLPKFYRIPPTLRGQSDSAQERGIDFSYESAVIATSIRYVDGDGFEPGIDIFLSNEGGLLAEIRGPDGGINLSERYIELLMLATRRAG